MTLLSRIKFIQGEGRKEEERDQKTKGKKCRHVLLHLAKDIFRRVSKLQRYCFPFLGRGGTKASGEAAIG